MELKHRWDDRVVFTGLYFVCFVAYLVLGFGLVNAADYDASASLLIPKINLISDVTKLELEDGELKTPDTIVGSYTRELNKTLLIGHSSLVFRDLDKTSVGDEIVYDNNIYHIISSEVLIKQDINMIKLLKKASRDTLVIMTCAGEDLGGGDATHRLIVTAVR